MTPCEKEDPMRSLIPSRVSVIMPVYNAERTLEAAAASVLNQTWRELELLLINDGSRDGSLELCRRIAARDSRVRVLTQENGGPAKARNAALSEITGEFVTFADSDDAMEPGACESMLRAIGETDLVISHFFFDMGKNSTDHGLIQEDKTVSEPEFLHLLMQRPTTFYYSALWNKLYRTRIILDNGISFDSFFDWGEDFVFNLQYDAHLTGGVRFLNRPVYHYIKTTGGTSVRSLLHVFHSLRIKWLLYQRFKSLYRQKGLYEKNRRLIRRYLFSVTLAD